MALSWRPPPWAKGPENVPNLRYPFGVPYLTPRGAEEFLMTRSRSLLVGVGVLAASAFALAITSGSDALAKGKKEAHLRYATSWADAIAQSRARNVPIFATFHKDK